MRKAGVSAILLTVVLQLAFGSSARAGTWRDHFQAAGLGLEWTGDRSSFQAGDGMLEGQSASPVAPSPLNLVEIAGDSTDCVVGCWMNVVERNNRVCTKGALLLRHSGTNGYVFALHEATQTLEVYRLATREMLLVKAARIDLRRWYYVQAELRGATMRFFVDGEMIGTVTDTLAPSGAVGVAVQDAEAVRFDDFSVTGPGVVGNVDAIARPELSRLEQSLGEVKFRFEALPAYDYFVQTSSTPRGHDWQTITNFRAKLQSFEAVVSDRMTNGIARRFYRVEKVDCNCD